MIQKLNSLVLLSLFLSACASHAPKSEVQNVPPTPEEIALVASIPGPPAIGTPEETADYQTLLNFQKTRTAKECERATSEVHVNLASFYGPPYGSLKKSELEKLQPLFDQLSQLTYHPDYIGYVKKHWSRARPYLTHTDLVPCVKKEPSFSYPSGHAAVSRLYYHVLSELYPKRTAKFLKRSDQIALDRNIAGVHFPTDIHDGKIIGDEIYDLIKKTDAYQKLIADFKAAK